MGVALSISALPVVAKTLLDLGLFKTDVGLLVMAAAMINDLVGWLAFSVLLGPMQGGVLDLPAVGKTLGLTAGFVAVALVLGRPLVGRLIVKAAHDQEVRTLAQIARAALEPQASLRLLQAGSLDEVLALLGAALSTTATKSPRRTSLADI